MSDGVERVESALEAQGVAATTTRTFDAAVPTAAAAAEQLGCEPGAIANSLLFKAGEGVVLVLSSGSRRVDIGRVARLVGVGKKKVRRADANLVLEVTGQRVGGVAPVGHPAPVRTLVDRELAKFEVVWAGAGDEYSMFATTAHTTSNFASSRSTSVLTGAGCPTGATPPTR